MKRSGSRGHAGTGDLVERTLAHARMAREPSAADRERVFTALRSHIDPSAAGCNPALNGHALNDHAVPDDALNDDAAPDDVVSGVREIARQEAALRPPVSPAARWIRPGSAASLLLALPASAQKLMLVGAVTGGLGFWLGSQPETASQTAGQEVAAQRSSSAPNPSPAQPSPPKQSSPSRAAPSASAAPLVAVDEVRRTAPLDPPVEPRAPVEGERERVRSAPATRAPARAPATPPRAHTPSPAAIPAPAPFMPAAPLSTTPPAAEPLFTTPKSATPLATTPQSALPLPALPPPASKPAPAPLTANAPSSGEPGFLEAVRLVQRAQRALERGAPLEALSHLDALDARFPAALLNEERLATRVLALCKLAGSTPNASAIVARAQRLAAELGARNPSSIYAARIAQSCAGARASSSGAPPAPRR